MGPVRAWLGWLAGVRRSLLGAPVVACACWAPEGLKVAASRADSGGEDPRADLLKVPADTASDIPGDEDAAVASRVLADWVEETVAGIGGWLAGVVLVVPRRHASVRYVRLPSSDPSEIREMTGYRLGELFPFDRTAAVYSATQVELHEDGSSTVMVSAIRRGVLRPFLAVAGALPVLAVITDTEASAMARGGRDDEGTLVAEWGGRAVLIYVPGGGTPLVYSRSAHVQASEARKIADEISSSIEVYESKFSSRAIGEIQLAGWGPAATAVSSEVASAVPSARVRTVSKPRAGSEPAGLECVVGPLLHTGDWRGGLCPPERSREVRRRGVWRQLGSTALLAALLGLLSAGLFAVRMTSMRAQVEALDRAMVEIEPEARRAMQMRRALSDLEVSRGGADVLDALAEVSNLVPPSVDLSGFNFTKGRLLDVTGTADTLDEVLLSARRLEESGLFSQARVRYANSRTGRQADVTDFRMVLTMGPAGEAP
jgi:hypothetical protein